MYQFIDNCRCLISNLFVPLLSLNLKVKTVAEGTFLPDVKNRDNYSGY